MQALSCGGDGGRPSATGSGGGGLTMGSGGNTDGTAGSSSGGGSDSASDSSPSFDVGDSSGGTGTNTGGDCPGGGGEEVDFSYIWIANSPEGTVSKIDTRTMVEEGRYVVSGTPSLLANQGPSRTSVGLDGDVAVADRDGGVVKIIADVEKCPDANGMPGVQTSAGPADVLPWGEDECVAWRIELPAATRPVAWTAAEQLAPCVTAEPQIWVSSPDPAGGVTVYLVGADQGTTEFTIEVPAADCNCPTFGLYGGAVDAQNDFWAFAREGPGGHGTGDLYVFRIATQSYEKWTPPAGHKSYGIAVDRDGKVWLAGDDSSLAYFDPASETFTAVDPGLPSAGYVLRGLMQDKAGHLWIAALDGWNGAAGQPGMLRVDALNGVAVEFLDDSVLTGLIRPAGTSIDVDGLVWLVDTNGDQAFRYDPASGDVRIVSGLDQPYTYSDMTGFGLKNVTNPNPG